MVKDGSSVDHSKNSFSVMESPGRKRLLLLVMMVRCCVLDLDRLNTNKSNGKEQDRDINKIIN